MVFFSLVFSQMFCFISGATLAHYQFGYNFGQVFYDLSNSGNHAQSGLSSNPDGYDITSTDKGAYFSGNNKYIRLPGNEINSNNINLQNTFSMVFWVNLAFDSSRSNNVYQIVFISNNVNSHFSFAWFADTNNCSFNLKSSGNSYIKDSNSGVMIPGKNHVGKWHSIFLVIDSNLVKSYINLSTAISLTIGVPYSILTTARFSIGHVGNSLLGYLWSFYLFDTVIDPLTFNSANYKPIYCFDNSCPATCDSTIQYAMKIACSSNSSIIECADCVLDLSNNKYLDCGYCKTNSCFGQYSQIKCPKVNSEFIFPCSAGYFASNNQFNCSECNEQCSSCTEANLCTSCISLNSEPDLDIGCNCIEGFYNSTNLLSISSCQSCYKTCKTCKNNLICLKCKDNNAIPSQSFGCKCKEGFYNLTNLEDGGICMKCNSDCNKCTDSLKCVSCIADNAEKDKNSGCICRVGFYNITSLNTSDSCLPCLNECYSCAEKFICKKCIDSNSKIMSTGGCLCNEGFYNQTQIISEGLCLKCHNECRTCNNPSHCLTCLDNNSRPSLDSGCDCIESFYKDTDGICKSCLKDCRNCISFTSCDLCNEKYSFFNGSHCICKEGFKPSRHSCIKKYFSAVLIVKSINLVVLRFSEKLKNNLKDKDFKISVEKRKDFNSTLLKSKGKIDYYFKLSFKQEVKKGSVIQVKILDDFLLSVNNSQLKDYITYAKLPSYNPNIQKSSIQVIISSATPIINIATLSSIGFTLFLNPSATWTLLNFIQILIYMPLNSNKMTPNLRIFLTGFTGFNIIPDILGSKVNGKASSSPYLEARRYGVESSVFLKNTGKILMIFGTAIVAWPFLFALSRCGCEKIALKAMKILENYRYNFFLRFWIQNYLDILIYSLVQLRSSVLKSSEGYFNFILAFIGAILAVMTLPLIFIFFYLNFNKITASSENLKKRWGSLFLEFKNDRGFISFLYYFLFFCRRAVFGIVQVYLNYLPFLQEGLNILFSAVVLAFLIYYKPFKERSIMITNFTGEIASTLVMILSYVYLWEISSLAGEIIEITIIFIVLSSIFIQNFVPLISFLNRLKILWNKLKKSKVYRM